MILRKVKRLHTKPEYKNTKPNTYHDYDLGVDKIPVYEPTNKKGGE